MLNSAWTMLKETVMDFIDDNCLSRGASIAYYTIFSIGPILLIVIAIAGFVFGQEAARGAIVGQLEGLMGREAAQTVQTALAGAGQSGSGVVATIIGIVTLLVAATGVFGELQYSLNQIWRAKAPEGVTGMLKARAASLGLVATFGFLLLVSLVVSAALTAVGNWLNTFVPGMATILQVVTFVVSLLILTVLFAAVYKILPDKPLTYKDVGIGAFATALMFTIGKTVIGLYIGRTSPASSFGAAGALVVFLVWVYYSSQIILLGAEFTKVYAIHHGSQALFEGSAASTVQTAPAQRDREALPVRPLGVFDIAVLGTLLVWVARSFTRRRA